MLDYDVVCNQVYPNSKKADSIISKNLLGHKKMTDYSFNIEKAKEEIAKSKYADNIQDYPIEVCWVAETPDREKLALLIQAAADQIGVKVNVVKTRSREVGISGDDSECDDDMVCGRLFRGRSNI